jgi:hypothetical protein
VAVALLPLRGHKIIAVIAKLLQEGGNDKVSKLRLLVASLLIVAVLSMVLPLAALAQSPPYFCSCTVYEDGVLASSGKVVKAYVGTETIPRAQATTDASGVAILQVQVTFEDFGPPAKAISFTVNDVATEETPDVDIIALATTVRLDVHSCCIDWPYRFLYDANSDGVISKAEAIAAVVDYFDYFITKAQVLEVVNLYFSQSLYCLPPINCTSF